MAKGDAEDANASKPERLVDVEGVDKGESLDLLPRAEDPGVAKGVGGNDEDENGDPGGSNVENGDGDGVALAEPKIFLPVTDAKGDAVDAYAAKPPYMFLAVLKSEVISKHKVQYSERASVFIYTASMQCIL